MGIAAAFSAFSAGISAMMGGYFMTLDIKLPILVFLFFNVISLFMIYNKYVDVFYKNSSIKE